MECRVAPTRRVALSLALLAPSLGSAAAADWSGSAALTSDYVWRGTSQSDAGPALQAGIRIAGKRGLYVQAWGSDVRFAPQTAASHELDLVAGWTGPLSEAFVLDAALTHYRYPGAAVDLDWTELGATLTWRTRAWLQLAHASDALASGAPGTYAQMGVRIPVDDRLWFEIAVGRYRLHAAGGDNDYNHVQAGVVWTLAAPLALRLTVHDTSASAQRAFGGWAGSRMEAALQASF
ncbi:hypothetical protein BEN78_08185 [Xanthomonas citri pv. mangiferaeindicae]|nr:hypothetical protein BEN78_08185 [Xanthomonas citri pv. mangiferaeindicae]